MPDSKKVRFSLDFQAIRNSEGKPVSEIQLFKMGKFVHWSGETFTVDDSFINDMVSNFEAMHAESKDQKIIPIDYNHSSLEASAEDAKAAGWIVGLNVKDDGLYAEVEWTSKAAEYIKNQEYRYISPEFAIDVTDEYGDSIDGAVLYAAGLTNRPFLKGMSSVSLSVKKQSKKEEKVQLKQVIKTLGLSEKATEEEISKEIEKVIQLNQDVAEKLELSEGESMVEKVQNLLSLNDQKEGELKKLSDKVDKLSDEQKTLKATQAVEDLVSSGRLNPANREKFVKLFKRDKESFDIACEALPKGDRFKVHGQGHAEDDDNSGDDFETIIKAYAKEHKTDYPTAFREVQKEHPKLAKAYAERR